MKSDGNNFSEMLFFAANNARQVTQSYGFQLTPPIPFFLLLDVQYPFKKIAPFLQLHSLTQSNSGTGAKKLLDRANALSCVEVGQVSARAVLITNLVIG